MIPFVLNSNGVPFAKYNALPLSHPSFSLRFNMRMFIKLISQKRLPTVDSVSAYLESSHPWWSGCSQERTLASQKLKWCTEYASNNLRQSERYCYVAPKWPNQSFIGSRKNSPSSLSEGWPNRGQPSLKSREAMAYHPSYLTIWNERIHNITSKEEGPDQPAASKTSCLDAWKESAIFARMPCSPNPDELGLSFLAFQLTCYCNWSWNSFEALFS